MAGLTALVTTFVTVVLIARVWELVKELIFGD